MVILALLLKPVFWFTAFRYGIRGDLNTMLLWASGVAVLLTVSDMVSVASNLAPPAIVLTLALYVLMSFTLLPLAWKVQKSWFSAPLNLLGLIGAFAGVNFTMDFLRGTLPFMNR